MSTTRGPKNSHCSYCGSRFAAGQPWPRTCGACGGVSYLNPLPVAVLLLPVDDGLLLVRRNLPDGRGRLALPGGFINLGESWQQAAARELLEETGVAADPGEVNHFQTLSAPDGTLLVFGLAGRGRRSAELPPFVPTDETVERVIATAPQELAFPLHTRVMREFFDRPAGGC